MKKRVLLFVAIALTINSYSQQKTNVQKKKDIKIIKVDSNIFSKKKKKQNTTDLKRNQNILMYPLPKVVAHGVYSNFNPDYKEVYVQVYRGEVSPLNIDFIKYGLITDILAGGKIDNYYHITIGGHTKYKDDPNYPEVGSYLYLHWKFETIEKYKDVIDLLENPIKGKLVLIGKRQRYLGQVSLYPLGLPDYFHIAK